MLKFGGTSYPLAIPDADTRSLARICDPFSSIYLEFCQTVINHYCQAAWIATGVGGDSKKTDRRACQQATTLPPERYLANVGYSFPLLALYPVNDQPAAMRTLRWSQTTTIYQLDYVLPPVTVEEGERVMGLLRAVRKLLVGVTDKLGDGSYQTGEELLGTAGVESVRFLQAEYGFVGGDGAAARPMIAMQLEVKDREMHDTTDDVALDRIKLTVQSVGENDDPTASFEVLSYSDTDPEA